MKPWEYKPKPRSSSSVGNKATSEFPKLENLALWFSEYPHLRVEHPSGLILDARPEHVRDAVKLHPWGVVYDCERRVLVSWGDVPRYAFMGKRDLETDDLLIPEAVAA